MHEEQQKLRYYAGRHQVTHNPPLIHPPKKSLLELK